MSRWIVLGGVLLVVAVVILASSAYVVREAEQVVVTEFGEIVGKPIREPGLHFKMPFIQKVNSFEKRWLEWDGDASQITTSDKRYIYIDTYARWRISDPVLFFQRLRDERSAQSRLDDIIDGATRNVVANHELIEAVRTSNRKFSDAGSRSLEPGGMDNAPAPDSAAGSGAPPQVISIEKGRDALTKKILAQVKPDLGKLGIELVDVKIKRINYIQSVQRKVYERMISERKRVAEAYRSEGRGRAAEILGRKEKELKEILSAAYRKSREIRGDGDAKAARIYAETYSTDPEFYRFLETMETYRKTIDANTWLVLGTGADYARLLRGMWSNDKVKRRGTRTRPASRPSPRPASPAAP